MHKKNGYGCNVSRRSIGTYPRWKSEYPTVGWYPRRLLRKYGSYQQCSCFIHSGCSQYHHQTVGQKYVPCHRKAIIDSDLGIMPENNGEVIRIGIPPLTEERRRQLAKQCKAEGETAKVSVRNARRDGIDALKKQ